MLMPATESTLALTGLCSVKIGRRPSEFTCDNRGMRYLGVMVVLQDSKNNCRTNSKQDEGTKDSVFLQTAYTHLQISSPETVPAAEDIIRGLPEHVRGGGASLPMTEAAAGETPRCAAWRTCRSLGTTA